MVPLPNFFVIGVGKAGTSSLYRYLAAHPNIYMSPVKEPRYFATDLDVVGPKREQVRDDWAVTSPDAYRHLFDEVQNEEAIGEASACYMESRVAAQNIFETVPDARLIAILRDPVERSYSHFQMHVRARTQRLPHFDSEEERVDYLIDRLSDSFYVRKGQYYEQLRRYFKRFDRRQIKVCFFDDLKTKPESLTKSIYSFLSVNPTFIPEEIGAVHNKGGVPRIQWIQEFIKTQSSLKSATKKLLPTGLYERAKWWIIERNKQESPELPARARKRLLPHYEEDIRRLEQELGVDLSDWLA